MQINVEKITGIDLMQWACSMTIDAESNASLFGIYKCEHSPMRTQLFKVELLGIPTFVSTHFVRHNIGVQHFVKTLRDDRGGLTSADRWTPTNHGMLINAQSLIQMARKRLCTKSHRNTRIVMEHLRLEVGKVDPDLMYHMIPECEYRGGCHELSPCPRARRFHVSI